MAGIDLRATAASLPPNPLQLEKKRRQKQGKAYNGLPPFYRLWVIKNLVKDQDYVIEDGDYKLTYAAAFKMIDSMPSYAGEVVLQHMQEHAKKNNTAYYTHSEQVQHTSMWSPN